MHNQLRTASEYNLDFHDRATLSSLIIVMSSEATNSAGWHSIRPWIPPLTLSVREITSVSVTFILSATSSGDTDPLLACLGIEAQETEDGVEIEENERKKPLIVSAALAGGLSVEVDRSAWRRVFIRIDDKADEAVIIIYGLMPGRQYDVDLELVQGGHKNNIRRQVVTELGGENRFPLFHDL